MEKEYIPALKFKSLTRFFDLFLKTFMKEEKIKKSFIKLAKLKDNFTILDFGCGTGTLLKIINKNVKSNLYGVDIDKHILNTARNKLLNSNIVLKRYDGIKLPFENNFFDIVFSSLVIHHLPKNRIPTFLEINRILKPNGKFYILDFGKQKNTYGRFVTGIIKRFEPIEENLKGEISLYLNQANFKDTKENKHHYKTLFGELTVYSGEK
ncbi:class I SAM-dependent methyltransferase [Candidatus Woesearchaeota archaeon]|nr:class I SAM-dependent methyltransferase [Candidatus Woesearchaeota archaeon]